MTKPKKFTLDHKTTASNPGEIQFNPLVWTRHRPIEVILYAASVLIAFYFSWTLSWWFLIFVIATLIANFYYWIAKIEHYTADSNPGIIVSESPPLYAVYTDLTKGSGHYPVIKVMEYKSYNPSNIGDKIATVATYSNHFGADSPFWSDFEPLPVEYATRNPDCIIGEMQSYSQQDWALLQQGLEKIEEPLEANKIYRIVSANSDWEPQSTLLN